MLQSRQIWKAIVDKFQTFAHNIKIGIGMYMWGLQWVQSVAIYAFTILWVEHNSLNLATQLIYSSILSCNFAVQLYSWCIFMLQFYSAIFWLQF